MREPLPTPADAVAGVFRRSTAEHDPACAQRANASMRALALRSHPYLTLAFAAAVAARLILQVV